jgi:hypothetical protein
MIAEFSLVAIDATLPLLEQQEIVQETIKPHLEEVLNFNPNAWREVLTAESLQGRYLDRKLPGGNQSLPRCVSTAIPYLDSRKRIYPES